MGAGQGIPYDCRRSGVRLVHSDVLLIGDRKEGKTDMLWTLFVILLVLWLLGVVSSYTLGGFIHLLLVLAVIVLVINLIQGRRTVV